MQTIFLLVSSTLRLKYDNAGSATRKEEEEEEVNSERESQQEQKTTITDNPAPPDPTLKYVWDIPDIKDKTKKSKRYVIDSCELYLQRPSGLVDECERLFG